MHYWKFVHVRGILSKLEILQRRSALPNIKHNYAVLFLKQIYSLSIYASKFIFSQTTNVNVNHKFMKPSQISDSSDVPAACFTPHNVTRTYLM